MSFCKQDDEGDDDDDDDGPYNSYHQVNGVHVFRINKKGIETDSEWKPTNVRKKKGGKTVLPTIKEVEQQAAQLIEANKIDPNRPFLSIKVNGVDEVQLWSTLVKDGFECFVHDFVTNTKRNQLTTPGQKYAFDQLK